MGVNGMLLANIISSALIVPVFVFSLKLWENFSLKYLDFKLAKEMIIYSIPLIPNRLSWSVINMSDRLIVMNYLGSSQSGIIAVSHKFPNLMDTIYGFFYQSWRESSARVVGKDDEKDFYNYVYTKLKDFMYSIVLGMTAFIPMVFNFMIDKSYHEALMYVPILFIAMYFSNMSGFYGGIFTAYKDTKIIGITTIFAAVINLFVHILMLSWFGLYAAAFSTLIANMAVYLYRKIKIKKYITLAEDRKKQFISIFITAVIFLLYYLKKPLFLICGCALSILYALCTNKNNILFFIKKAKTKK